MIENSYMDRRSSGILMHISSLPSPYGIGTFGKEAYEFVDFLSKAGQGFWQILPLCPTSYGDSPYQSTSAFAGNPYFIDFSILVEEGLLKLEEYEGIDFGSDATKVDYEKIFAKKMPVLRIAFERGIKKYKYGLNAFKEENKGWILDYALYMALKEKFNLKSWIEWDEDIRLRNKSSLKKYSKGLKKEMDYWIFLQYLFFTQWEALKSYANSKGIRIIGDLPIYVSEDSADTWSNSEIFMFDYNKRPLVVSGCPPDDFSSTGQLWGNPIYRWEVLEKGNFKWWIERIRGNMKLYDVIRLDHFRGFKAFWQVPYGEETAVNGEWVKGPGIKLFNSIKESLGKVNIIAEDLGFLTKEAIDFKNETGYPGMKILEFAFNGGGENPYLPHNYDKNSVVYTGTHDNETVMQWMKNAKVSEVEHAKRYFNLSKEEGYNWGFIRGAFSSVSNLAIIPIQDYLGLDSDGRMNIPSTTGGNWRWRIRAEDLDDNLAEKILEVTKLYGREKAYF